MGARPLGAASAVYGAAPWAFSAADAWKVVSPIHMGIMRLHYEGSYCCPVPQVPSPYAFTNRQLLFLLAKAAFSGASSTLRMGARSSPAMWLTMKKSPLSKPTYSDSICG